MIYVTGDYHGGLDAWKITPAEWPLGQQLSREDYLVIAGDLGLPWGFGEEETWEIETLEHGPWTTLFVDGNHERFDYWAEQPVEPWCSGRVQRLREGSPVRRLMRGEVYEIDGMRVFTMGGATSVDRAFRVEGASWWPVELPDEDDFERARAALDEVDWKVDFVITHTCATRLLAKALWPQSISQRPDPDRLTDFFDELEDRLEFRQWYFGHFHNDRVIDERHTCLYNRIVPIGETVTRDL